MHIMQSTDAGEGFVNTLHRQIAACGEHFAHSEMFLVLLKGQSYMMEGLAMRLDDIGNITIGAVERFDHFNIHTADVQMVDTDAHGRADEHILHREITIARDGDLGPRNRHQKLCCTFSVVSKQSKMIKNGMDFAEFLHQLVNCFHVSVRSFLQIKNIYSSMALNAWICCLMACSTGRRSALEAP